MSDFSDPNDLASTLEELHKEDAIKKIRDNAAKIPEGVPGECEHCGYYYTRLIGGNCAGCRDKYKLK